MIRLLTKDEAIGHFIALSPEDRYTRFCMTASDEYIKSYVSRSVGFFYGTIEFHVMKAPVITGVIHIVHDLNTKSVEVAVSVLPEAKGKGIAKKLMYFANGVAEMYGADKMKISGLSKNSPMIQLAKKCGYEVHHECGEFEGEAQTIGADIKTIMNNNIKLFNIFLRGKPCES